MIRGDASLAYQDLADVLSACDEAGIRNVRLPVRSRDATIKNAVIIESIGATDRIKIWRRMEHRWITSGSFVRFGDRAQPDHAQRIRHDSGPWLYAVLFLIIFAETGLVVTPFLPGDSLLFAVGAVAAHPESPIKLGLVAVLLVIAAVLGDAVNYCDRLPPRPPRLLARRFVAAEQEAPAAGPRFL